MDRYLLRTPKGHVWTNAERTKDGESEVCVPAYQVFVHSGIKVELPLKAIKGQLFLDQENFIQEIKHLMRGKERLKEITKEQRYLTRQPLNEIFKDKDKKSKNQVMYEVHLKYDHTLKDIAEYLGDLLYYPE